MIILDIFTQSVVESPGAQSFTEHLLEILIMLLISFALGYLLRMAIGAKHKARAIELERELKALKAERRGFDDNRMTATTLESKVILLEQKNNILKGEMESLRTASKPDLSVYQLKIDRLAAENTKLKADLEICLNAKPAVMSSSKASAEPKEIKLNIKTSTTSSSDDLKKIEGVGPKIESILNGISIHTFTELSQANPQRIKDALIAQGPRYQMHDPTTWPSQAALAASGDWTGLKAIQAELKGGRKS
ncbi:MAG: putative flap endonuclease-1-like 5' DNA nuclease [Bacteroidia bacterium]|jgi:predicted flap endonuclease-1-like 5' DNA nuclease